MSRSELARYSRHLSLPEVGVAGQQRLGAARVMVVGAGGLGSPAAMYLAAAGVGRLGVIDFDTVDLTNLQRQLLHETADVGRPKTESARERLEHLNPEIRIVTHQTRLDSSNALDILRGYDVIVDGSDNFPTRYLLNDATVLLGIPLVYGAIFRFEGQASVFGTPGGPCYRCLFREPPPADLVPNCADAGVLGVLPGIVGTIQAAETLKLILGRGTTLAGRLLMVDALSMEFRELRIRRDPECPACGEHPSITELVDYEQLCRSGGASALPPDATGAEAAGVPAGGARESADRVSRAPSIEIGARELKARLDHGERVCIVDVREPYEWDICNLEPWGARLIPLGELLDHLDELRHAGTLVLHCHSGARAAAATAMLHNAGVLEARNLRGGILAWARDVDPSLPTY